MTRGYGGFGLYEVGVFGSKTVSEMDFSLFPIHETYPREKG